MKIIPRLLNVNFLTRCYKHVYALLVVSILSFALKSPARFVDYNFRTIVELSPTEERIGPSGQPHATVSKHCNLNL